jgi:diguanylate cyclase (GGDEF)-like protein/PAS domain S-box-containing protein
LRAFIGLILFTIFSVNAAEVEDNSMMILWQIAFVICMVLLVVIVRQRALRKYTKQLESQQELYNAVFENSVHGVLIIDAATKRFISCNQQIVEILRLNSKDDVLNLHPSELSPEFQPDGRRSDEKADEMMLKAVEEGINNFEWKHIRGDQEEFWAEINLTSIVLDDKHLIHVTWKDIDSKKEADARLQDLSERMELALIGNNDGLFDWNMKEDSIYYSPRWKEIIGYKDDELVNLFISWEDRVYPEDLPKVMAAVQDTVEGRKEYFENEHRMRHKDGHWVWISARGKVFSDENGVPIRLIGTHTDITEDKEMQIEFVHQAQIIKQVRDAVISTDLEGKITSWNIGAGLLLGYKSEEVLGENISLLYSQEDFRFIHEHMEKIIEEGEYHTSVQLLKKSQEAIFAELTLSLLKDEHDKPLGMIVYAQDISEKQAAEQELYKQKAVLDYQAHHDMLTGLPNRTLFSDRLELGIKRAKRNETSLALFFIDLDHFKQINDSLGHEIGDKVLQTVTNRLQQQIRDEDTFARLGGDEFTIIMESLQHEEDASIVAQKILDVLTQPIIIDEQKLYVSTSIGISLYPKDGNDASDLLKYADTAMYKAKDAGRNNVQFYSSEMTELAFQRVEMERDLRQALENDEFIIYYQPQIDGRTEKLIGMEALIRWEHPTKGMVSPGEFISFAEETGLIVAMDLWVMQTAIKQFVKWYTEGLTPGVLSLNLSVKQFQIQDFLLLLKETIAVTGMKESWLEFEVTEGQVMTNAEEAIARLNDINDLGIKLSIDDFGTGYSSLSYLKRLPIDKLKIDQSFVFGLPDDEEDASISKAIIALANSLNLSVIAEGVETQEQKEFLVTNGCPLIQGYLYAKPMPADDIFNTFLQA